MAAADVQLSEADVIEAAAARLALALEALDAAAERRREADRRAQSMVDQFHALGSDRARLASELDEAAARVRGLETANREVAARVDAAIEIIHGVLNASE